MISFFICLSVLILGYCLYGNYAVKVFGIDGRVMPAVALRDEVDYVPMPVWKTFLIQLLNIAGLGPIFGALAGACWGPTVFLWITLGTIFCGMIHDFLVGMMSERLGGCTIAELTGEYLGPVIKQIMFVFSVVLLILCGVTFTTGPAFLIDLLTEGVSDKNFWIIVLLVYYLLATFISIDKIIGRIYPVFGIFLILMALGVGFGTVFGPYEIPEIVPENLHPDGVPIWPVMFISVACGAISGFHATQSPLMARCINSEKEGRFVFMGAMLTEGIIALIWAAAGVAFYKSTGGLLEVLKNGQAQAVYEICSGMLGKTGMVIAMIGVIACPITSADTAFRSARLTLADWLKLDQKSLKNRLLLTLPILLIAAFLTQIDVQVVWRYFSWSNQTLAMIALWTGAVFLHKNGRVSLPAAIPAAFMTAVSCTYILYAKEGLELSKGISYTVGIVFAILCMSAYIYKATTEKPDPEGERAKQTAAVPQASGGKPKKGNAAAADENGRPAIPPKYQQRLRI